VLLKAQVPQSLPAQSLVKPDSTPASVIPLRSLYAISLDSFLIKNKFFNQNNISEAYPVQLKKRVSRELVFYSVIGLLLFFGVLRTSFSGYFANLLQVFFSSKMSVTQSKEQLQNAKLQSLIFNVFATASIAIFCFYAFKTTGTIKPTAHWLNSLYVLVGVTAVLLAKYVFVTFVGWLCNEKEIAKTYNAIVFLVYKAVGIILLPLTVILVTAEPLWRSNILHIATYVLTAMLIFRYVKVIKAFHNQINISYANLFVYVVGFELLPTIIFYRISLQIMSNFS
jgi:Domain of unknown function (DUF4271)